MERGRFFDGPDGRGLGSTEVWASSTGWRIPGSFGTGGGTGMSGSCSHAQCLERGHSSLNDASNAEVTMFKKGTG